jgi:hypothetical protein
MPSTDSASFKRQTRPSEMIDGNWRRNGFNKIPQRNAFGHNYLALGDSDQSTLTQVKKISGS